MMFKKLICFCLVVAIVRSDATKKINYKCLRPSARATAAPVLPKPALMSIKEKHPSRYYQSEGEQNTLVTSNS
ncbi:hypothetical protein J6590_105368 [Homalodisca vitripennis]|nr:hypothetical protein J6590_105368 [Homalodisca vitripennis]